MEPGTHEEREAALRPLRTAGRAVEGLRRGTLAGDEARSAGIQIASAVEMSLRRVLRDHPGIALPVRLRALAPDELTADEVLAELRQHDRISIALAASVHDLLETRRRLKSGAPAESFEQARILEVVDRVEQEVLYPRHPAPAPGVVAVGETELAPAPDDDEEESGQRRWKPAYTLALVAALLLVLVPAGYFLARGSNADAELEQGIALFRTGAYADAASHFYRHAQANPDDATPHLYLARVHRRLERYDLATQSIQEAMELSPEDPAAYTELGLLLTDLRRYDEAVGRFREAIRLDGESPPAWIGLVRALRAAGREDAATAVLASAPAEVRAMLARPAGAADSLAL